MHNSTTITITGLVFLLGSLLMLVSLTGDNMFLKAMPYEEEEYKSYERDNFQNSKDNIVNKNNCNINNINVNTRGNSNVGSSSGELVATNQNGIEEETYAKALGTNGERYEDDGYDKKDKGVVGSVNLRDNYLH